MDSGLAAVLQQNFRYSQLCRSRLGTYGYSPPSGDEATRQLRARHANYNIQRNRSKKTPTRIPHLLSNKFPLLFEDQYMNNRTSDPSSIYIVNH